MALINHNKIKIVARILAKVGCWLAVFIGTAHKGLKDGKEYAPIGGYLAILLNLIGFDTGKGAFGKGGKGVEGLICQDIAVGKKQDARTA